VVLWLSLAFATWVEEDDGFVSSPRSDAPVDGWLLYEANVDPEATVVDGPGAPFVLDAVVVETEAPMAILFPPDGGWEAGASYTVEARGSLTFTVGDAEAPPAVDPEITSIEVGDWSEREHEYVGGCCAQIRPVVVELNLPGGDRWAFSELHAGDGYVGGVRDLSVGSGRHVLRLQQHLSEGKEPVPACFDVVSRNAGGWPGSTRSFCTDYRGNTWEGGPDRLCRCDSGAGAEGGWVLGLLLAFAGRRRKR